MRSVLLAFAIASAGVVAACEEKSAQSSTNAPPARDPIDPVASNTASAIVEHGERHTDPMHEHALDDQALASSTTSAAAAPAAHHCEGSPVQCAQNAAPPLPQPTAEGQLYGAALDPQLKTTPLTELLAHPELFASKTVRTSGTIGRVCQHRGCWMELRAEQGDSVVRVPMAGHAFFVPSDSSGRSATIQGSVSVREGSDNPLRIDATSVLIASR